MEFNIVGVEENTLVSLGNHRALPIKILYDQLHNNIHSFIDPNEHNNIPVNDKTVDLKLNIKGLQTYPAEELIYKYEQ